MCATVMFNTEKLLGFYPDVPWMITIIFGIMDIVFFAIAVCIVKTSFDKEGYLKEGRLKIGKLFSAFNRWKQSNRRIPLGLCKVK